MSDHIFAPNGGYCLYYPSNLFRNARRFENWGIYKQKVAIWRENMLGYLSADSICSEKRTVFRERSSRKTYYPSNLFRNARSFENWGIFNNYFMSERLI